jgi:hypothetical protein
MDVLRSLRAGTYPHVRGGQYFGPSSFLEVRGHPKLVRSSAHSRDRDIQRRQSTIDPRDGLTNRCPHSQRNHNAKRRPCRHGDK